MSAKSMEFIRTGNAPLSMTRAVPWNSMEFHGTSRVNEIGALQFHGIPWNCSCQRNWRILNSMEFHGTARVIEIGALLVPWNSMEYNGTARISEISALQVPWNSMEFHGTARVNEIGALQVPWN